MSEFSNNYIIQCAINDLLRFVKHRKKDDIFHNIQCEENDLTEFKSSIHSKYKKLIHIDWISPPGLYYRVITIKLNPEFFHDYLNFINKYEEFDIFHTRTFTKEDI